MDEDLSAPVWSTACPDWEKRIVEGRSLIPCSPLFPEEARAARAVLGGLRVIDVAGRPTMLEACRPWALEFVDAVFGAYDHSIGRRLIVEFFLLISKKNTKSTLAAAIMLTALIRNWRDSNECLILAPTLEIANNSFKPARDMVSASPELSAIMHVSVPNRAITHRTTGASLKVVAADSDTVSGKKAAFVLVDEAWLFGKRHDAENMLLEATGGLASRPEGFVIWLTTQSDAPPAGVFKKKLHHFRQVRDGIVTDPRSLGVLYEFPERMLKAQAWRDPSTWRMTNPNLGLSVDMQFLAAKMREGEAGGESSLRAFAAKHLNVEIGIGLGSNGWGGAEFWERQADTTLTFAELLRRCEVVTIGVDGGGKDDLLGFGAVGRERGTGRWLMWNRAWAWPSALQQRQSNVTKYEDFAEADELVIVDTVGEDMLDLVGLVVQARNAGLLPDKHAIGVDPGRHQAVTRALLAAEIPSDQIAFVSQGWRLGGPMELAERMLAEGTLRHAGQALMAWCVSCAKVEKKGNATIVTKQASDGKIDPLMAGLNAIELMARNPVAGGLVTGSDILMVL